MNITTTPMGTVGDWCSYCLIITLLSGGLVSRGLDCTFCTHLGASDYHRHSFYEGDNKHWCNKVS